MQLERATVRSGEAGLAGWISSNDVTLFTMVLVVVIALFLQTRLIKGSRENDKLTVEKSSLSKELQDAESELDSTSGKLRDVEQSLQLTQAQRDRLDQDLLAALDKINELNNSVSSLTAKSSVLEEEKQAEIEARQRLASERDALTESQESLRDERQSLQQDRAALTERLSVITRQLAEKLELLREVESERNRLAEQTTELDAIVSGLKQQMADANIKLTDAEQQAELARREWNEKYQNLEAEISAGERQSRDLIEQLKRSTELTTDLIAEKSRLETQLVDVERQFELQLLRETRVNRELVGLRGGLRRVAILFDASGSMQQKGTDGEDNRWVEAQRIAATWLQHLDVDQCVLIVFSSDVRTFPADGSLADVRGEAGKVQRAALMERLNSVVPQGWTNTLDALRKAYQYEGVDSILLFSDGAPSAANTGTFDPAVAQQIYALCREHPDVPINAIGLGNYFDKDLSTFLRTVARITGGTFRGR